MQKMKLIFLIILGVTINSYSSNINAPSVKNYVKDFTKEIKSSTVACQNGNAEQCYGLWVIYANCEDSN